jgi:hypothetical protein
MLSSFFRYLFHSVRDASRNEFFSVFLSSSPFSFLFFFLQDALIHTSPYYFLSFPPGPHVVFVLGSHPKSRLYPQSDLYYYDVFYAFSPRPSPSSCSVIAWVGVSVTIKSRPPLYSHIKMTNEKRWCFITASSLDDVELRALPGFHMQLSYVIGM